MKIQCSCGAKYAFDVTPEMAQAPIQFVCQNCGLDSSEVVNDLIRRELASPALLGVPLSAEVAHAPPAAQPAGPARIRVSAKKAAETPSMSTEMLQSCAKHPGQVATHRCLVCGKPICPKCMEVFGYVCSPLCKAKAEAQGVVVPVYAGQKSVVEARQWRKVGLIGGAIVTAVGGLLGFWVWYAWFGSVPKPVFSVRFAERAYSGQSALCGQDQIVFLHGGTLARHDMKTKQQIWSRQLIDRKQIADQVAREVKELQERKKKISDENPDAADGIKPPSQQMLAEMMEKVAAAALGLHVRGRNIWVSSPDKLARYDWDTGKPAQEIPLKTGWSGLISRGDELLRVDDPEPGQQVVTRISLVSGESRVERVGELQGLRAGVAATKKPGRDTMGPADSPGKAMAGLPLGAPGADAGRPLDPAKVAEQAQNLSLPAKIALPAVLANALNQERTLAELSDSPRRAPQPATTPPQGEVTEQFSLIPGKYGYVQFAVRLLESRLVQRDAMKAPPAKSALDGNLTVTKTAEVANEMLNEMQRSRGGDKVTEDQSRYQVTVRRPGAKDVPDWTGEVIGPPALFALKTVDVIAAGKTLVVLDKANKKLWQSALSFSVADGGGAGDEDAAPFGQGPCVERGNTLYVFDEGVLTAFELATGRARWRLPSIGVAGLFFDDQGMVYVNTSTASPEKLKYSRQIDVTEKIGTVIHKIDSTTGKTLWTSYGNGLISYVSGKFIYTVESHQGDDGEENPYATGLEIPSHVMIRRLNPANGRLMWVHYQKRAPLHVGFDGNSIQLVFRKEVQVLTFLSL